MTDIPDLAEERQNTFQRNMEAMEKHYPMLHRRLKTLQPSLRIVGSKETGDLNLDLGHDLLYVGGAVSHAEAQLAEFRSRPGRFYMNLPAALREDRDKNQDNHHQYIAEAIYEHFERFAVSALPVLPTEDSGFLLVYGIGLGCHLPALLEEVDVQHFVLVEQFHEFFYHSMFLQDWAGFIERATERGQEIRLFFGDDPHLISAQIHWYMRGEGFGLIDGSYIFRHASTMLLNKAYDQFVEKLPLLPVSAGFFEDEIVMTRNGTINPLRHPFLLLDKTPRLKKETPAVIVGSGPSLDQNIEVLRQIRERVVLFSCGTGLIPLLQNGIRPDFHCELENGATSYEHAARAAELHGGLKDITLIGAMTVDPRMPALFGRIIFYFRDSVTSTALWGEDPRGLLGTAPTCTNLGLRAATLLAFNEIYLFGVDLGSRRPDRQHSRHSLYKTDEEWAEIEKKYMKMTVELPGNFGGRAFTNPVLQWARMMMEEAIMGSVGVQIYNCSDGVSIPGTIPKLGRSVKISVTPVQRQQDLRRIEAELKHFAAGELIDATRLHAVREEMRSRFDRLMERLDDAGESGETLLEFYRTMLPHISDQNPDRNSIAFRSYTVGMLMMSFQMAYFFYHRVLEKDRAEVTKVFLESLHERLAAMQSELDQLFEELEQERAEWPQHAA